MSKPKNHIPLDYVVALGLALSGNLSTPCFAEVFHLSTLGTATLVKTCRDAGDPLQDDCSGYILGVFDQMVLSHLICPRSNPSGLTAQAVAVALRSLNDHPEKWDQPPAFLIGESFKAAFPCGG